MKRRMKGTGSIYKRPDRDSWEYQFTFPDGTKKRLSAKTKQLLLEKINEYNIEILTKRNTKKSDLTLLDIMNKLNDIKLNLNKIKISSYNRRKETIKMSSSINDMKIQDITKEDILEFYMYIAKNYSNNTISKIVILLKEAYRYALDEKIIAENLIEKIDKPISYKKDKEVKALTVEEQKRFMDAIPNSRYYLIYLIVINTGMRGGEILALHKKDIDFNNNVININKTITRGKNNRPSLGDTTKTKTGIRKVPLINSTLKSILLEYVSNLENEALFAKNGNFILSQSVNAEFQRLNAKYNISNDRVNFHMLRHTFATRCIESGMPAVVLAKLLGHSDISTTLNTYTSVFDEFQNESLNKMNEYMQKLES